MLLEEAFGDCHMGAFKKIGAIRGFLRGNPKRQERIICEVCWGNPLWQLSHGSLCCG